MADLDAVLAMRVACERADRTLGAATTRGEMLAAWQAHDTRLATDTWVVTTAEGRVVASAEISPHPLGATEVLQVWVLPDQRGHGIEATLLHLAETRARAIGAEAGSGPLTLFTQVLDANTALRQALSDASYALTSSFQVMEITMAEPPLPPQAIPAIDIRPFVVGRDEQAVYAADEEAFLDERGKTPRTFEQWSRRLNLSENFDPTLWLVAWDGDQVAGSALNEATIEAGRKVGRIHHLGVRRPWRRRGLGMALLRQTLGAFYRRDLATVRLNVDAQRLTNAHRLYARAGFAVANMYHNYSKELTTALG
jgi:GNAT superfamily N-acetyltransferase